MVVSRSTTSLPPTSTSAVSQSSPVAPQSATGQVSAVSYHNSNYATSSAVDTTAERFSTASSAADAFRHRRLKLLWLGGADSRTRLPGAPAPR